MLPLLEKKGADFAEPVQWFYDPMAVTAFAGHLGESAIVYDCMDQLSQFHGAPSELVRRERELLAIADVVFAGGPKICEEKRQHNGNCYSIGCGVDGRGGGPGVIREPVAPGQLPESLAVERVESGAKALVAAHNLA